MKDILTVSGSPGLPLDPTAEDLVLPNCPAK